MIYGVKWRAAPGRGARGARRSPAVTGASTHGQGRCTPIDSGPVRAVGPLASFLWAPAEPGRFNGCPGGMSRSAWASTASRHRQNGRARTSADRTRGRPGWSSGLGWPKIRQRAKPGAWRSRSTGVLRGGRHWKKAADRSIAQGAHNCLPRRHRPPFGRSGQPSGTTRPRR